MSEHAEPSVDAQYIGDQIRAGLESVAERLGGSRDPENVSMSTKMVADALEEIAGQLTNLVQAVDGISTETHSPAPHEPGCARVR